MQTPNTEQIQTVIYSQDLIEQIAELSVLINESHLGIEIEPLKIYCQKTGAIIGHRDENSLFSLIKICGKNAIVSNLYNATTLSVHPAWICTDGESLDNLIESDPIGYACFCFAIITRDTYRNIKNQDPRREPWIERYWALARANKLMRDRGTANLTELNIELCKFLTYEKDTKAYLLKRAQDFAKSPDNLALLHANGELIDLLRQCTNRALAMLGDIDQYVKRTRYVEIAQTPADAARGPSNIRQQKASKRDIQEAKQVFELQKLFAEAGLDIRYEISKATPHTMDFIKRRKEEQAAREQELYNELIAAGGSNLFTDVDDSAEADDDKIEIRKLAIAKNIVNSLTDEAILSVNPDYKTKIIPLSNEFQRDEVQIKNQMLSIERDVKQNAPKGTFAATVNVDKTVTYQISNKPTSLFAKLKAQKVQS